MPDITKADVLAIIQAALAVAVVFGIDMSTEQVAALTALSAALAVALPLADAKRRNGRVPLVMQREAISDQKVRLGYDDTSKG